MRDVDSAMCALLLHAQCSALSRSQVKTSSLYTTWAAQPGHPPARHPSPMEWVVEGWEAGESDQSLPARLRLL